MNLLYLKCEMRHIRLCIAIIALSTVGCGEEKQSGSVERKTAANLTHRTPTDSPKKQVPEVIGCWIDERSFGGGLITVSRENSKLYIERTFKDKSSFRKEIVEEQSPVGRRFDYIEGSAHGDYYVIDSRGNLQICDNDGLITTAKKIK